MPKIAYEYDSIQNQKYLKLHLEHPLLKTILSFFIKLNLISNLC